MCQAFPYPEPPMTSYTVMYYVRALPYMRMLAGMLSEVVMSNLN